LAHRDNAPGHKAHSVKESLAQKSVTEMEHPPSSPNDLWQFPKIKSALNVRKFQDTKDIKNVMTPL
jgi:hypothetical protein